MADGATSVATRRSKPALLSVDDDPRVSQAIARDLRGEYGEHFRILRAESGASALEVLRQLKLRDDRGFILSGLDLMQGGSPPRGWPLERDPFPLETSVPGVFVAGDVRHSYVKRVATAVGEGSTAVSLVHQYLAKP